MAKVGDNRTKVVDSMKLFDIERQLYYIPRQNGTAPRRSYTGTAGRWSVVRRETGDWRSGLVHVIRVVTAVLKPNDETTRNFTKKLQMPGRNPTVRERAST